MIAARPDTRTPAARLPVWWQAVTMPWDVPPRTVVVELVDGRWRVVPHRWLVRIFRTREEALAWAQIIASMFDPVWHIVEVPREEDARSAAS